MFEYLLINSRQLRNLEVNLMIDFFSRKRTTDAPEHGEKIVLNNFLINNWC